MAKWITPSHPESEPVTIRKEEGMVPVLDGIDTASGLERTQGNTRLYLKLLRKTGKSQAGFFDEFEEAIQKQEWDVAERLAHTLKGLSGNIGAMSLQQAALKLESGAREHQVDALDKHALETELKRVLISISTLEPANGTVHHESIDTAVLDDVIHLLSKQLADFDTLALETLESHRELLGHGSLKSHALALEKALESYDFEKAQTLLEEMKTDVRNTGDGRENKPESESVQAVIEKLVAMIESYDTGAADLLDAEEPLLTRAGFKSEIKKIRNSLEAYDFDSALDTIRGMGHDQKNNEPM